MKTQSNSGSTRIPGHISEGHLGEMLRRHLPGRAVTDGSENWSAPKQILLRQGDTDYAPWLSRPDHISTWTPDRFESDLERYGDGAIDHLDFGSAVRDLHPLRHFD
jgi:hypothetical protein